MRFTRAKRTMWALIIVTFALGIHRAASEHDVVSNEADYQDIRLPPPWKIIGGEEAKYGEFPFMLSMERSGQFICGASAIGDNWALTAAHCIQDQEDPERFALRAGSLKKMEGGTLHHAVQLIAHHLFAVDNNYDNDVGLIRVREPLTGNKYVKLMPLPSHADLPLPPGTHLTVTGWGATKPMDMGSAAYILKKAAVVVLTKKTCEDDPVLSGIFLITKNMICAQETGQTAYKGDSGGPLFIRTGEGVMQVGVVSWGDFTGHQKHPTVFTRLANYRLWIRIKSGI